MSDVLVSSIQQLCISRKWTLSLAESCTGGHLAARLTQQPGCSHYFLGSLVTYSNDLKMNLLGVNAHVLATEGAVSGPVVSQMARGVLKLTRSDFSLAVSGIAGPEGGSLEKPVGTVWGAIGMRDEDPFIWNFHLSGTRQEIIEKSVNVILAEFWSWIKKN